jgi:hypothetical protein
MRGICNSCGEEDPPIMLKVGTWQDHYLDEAWCVPCVLGLYPSMKEEE